MPKFLMFTLFFSGLSYAQSTTICPIENNQTILKAANIQRVEPGFESMIRIDEDVETFDPSSEEAELRTNYFLIIIPSDGTTSEKSIYWQISPKIFTFNSKEKSLTIGNKTYSCNK